MVMTAPTLDDLDDAALDALPFGVVCLDENLQVVRFNRAEAERTGIQRWRVLGRTYFGDVVPARDGPLASEVRGFFRSAVPTRAIDHTFTRRTGAEAAHIELSHGDGRVYLAIHR
jgi:photoactive yellow protein